MARSDGVALPQGTQLVASRAHLAYFDSRSVPLARPITALAAWNAMMAEPIPLVRQAMAIRDSISARFGVRPIGGFSGRNRAQVQAGDTLDFFLVEYVSDQVLTLTARDSHLDVMTCITTSDDRLAVTSSVVTHNAFGRLYMLPVGPAHKLIVGYVLRRFARQSAAG